jgi:hypothetical protein
MIKQYKDYPTFSELVRTTKFPKIVLKAAKLAAEKELAEIKAWMRLTGQ